MQVSHPLIVILGLAAVYTLPAFVAVALGRRHQWGVLALNLAAGWTVVGWLLALRWALAKSRTSRRAPRRERMRTASVGADTRANVADERPPRASQWPEAAERLDPYARWLETGAVERQASSTASSEPTGANGACPQTVSKVTRRPAELFVPETVAA